MASAAAAKDILEASEAVLSSSASSPVNRCTVFARHLANGSKGTEIGFLTVDLEEGGFDGGGEEGVDAGCDGDGFKETGNTFVLLLDAFPANFIANLEAGGWKSITACFFDCII
jgi:hypothetical protein